MTLTLVESSSPQAGNFMQRNPDLRALIANSGITPEEVSLSIKLMRGKYKALDAELPDGHQWKYSKALHAEHCAEEVETHAPLFGFEGLECDVFRFILYGHDVGRLEQGIRRSRGETVDDQLHGKLSVDHIFEALTADPNQIPSLFIKGPARCLQTVTPIWSMIFKAIECHSLRDTPTIVELGDHAPALPLIQVMRDTDKLGGFDSAKSYTEDPERKDRERRANWTARLDIDPQQGTELGLIDPPFLLWYRFLRGKSLLRADCRGYESYILQLLAWCFDVNTPEMLQVIFDRGGPQAAFRYLIKRLAIGEEQLEIRAHRLEAQAQHEALLEWAQTWQGGILLKD